MTRSVPPQPLKRIPPGISPTEWVGSEPADGTWGWLADYGITPVAKGVQVYARPANAKQIISLGLTLIELGSAMQQAKE